MTERVEVEEKNVVGWQLAWFGKGEDGKGKKAGGVTSVRLTLTLMLYEYSLVI